MADSSLGNNSLRQLDQRSAREGSSANSDELAQSAGRSTSRAHKHYYLCEFEGCEKTFATASHRSRHMRNHTGSTPYPCFYCSKRFNRSDVRNRHQSLSHPDNVQQATTTSSVAHERPSGAPVLRNTEIHVSPARSLTFANGSTPDSLDSRAQVISPQGSTQGSEIRRSNSLNQGLYSNMATRHGPSGSNAMNASYEQDVDRYNPSGIPLPEPSGYSNPLDLILQAAAERLSAGGTSQAGYATLQTPQSALNFPNDSPLDPNLAEEIMHDVFGWGVGTDSWDPTSAWDMLNFGPGWNMAPLDDESLGLDEDGWTYGQRYDPMMSEAAQRGLTDGVPLRVGESEQPNGGSNDERADDETAWPHVFRPPKAPSQRRLKLAEPIAASRLSNFGPQPATYVQSQHVQALMHLAQVSHETAFENGIDLANFPDASILSTCTALYFRHFHPVLPILRQSLFESAHKPGTSIGPHHALLLLTVAAIGTTYAQDDWKPLSIYLHELGRRAGKYLHDSDPRSMFSIPYVQSRLLQALAGYANGSRELYLEAEISRGFLVTAARRLHLLRAPQGKPIRFNAQTVGGPSRIEPGDVPIRLSVQQTDNRAQTESLERDLERRWKRWLDQEERRRLGWGIYLFDAQLGTLLNIPYQFAISEVVAQLPDHEDRWSAADAISWDAALDKRQSSPPSRNPVEFSKVLKHLLQSLEMDTSLLSDFGSNIMAYTLYRLGDEAQKINTLFGVDPTSPDTGDATTGRINKPFLLLEELARSSQTSLTHRSSFLVANDALRHHAYLRFTHAEFFDKVRLAAGKHQTLASKRESRQWLQNWLSTSQIDARRIFAHVAQLSALLMRYTFDAPWEPIWLLDCALAMWAILHFLPDIASSASPDRSGRSLIKWTDSPDRWIQDGGPIRFQGISYTLTSENVLTDFIGRLEAMPWGLGRLYEHVLSRLLREVQTGSVDGEK